MKLSYTYLPAEDSTIRLYTRSSLSGSFAGSARSEMQLNVTVAQAGSRQWTGKRQAPPLPSGQMPAGAVSGRLGANRPGSQVCGAPPAVADQYAVASSL